MKRYLLVLTAVLCLFAWSKDDAKEESFSVVGKWELTAYQTTAGSYIGQEDGSYFLFGSDGSFTYFYSGWGAINKTVTGNYRQEGSLCVKLAFEGEAATIYITNLQENGEAAFSIDGGLLTTGNYKFKRR